MVSTTTLPPRPFLPTLALSPLKSFPGLTLNTSTCTCHPHAIRRMPSTACHPPDASFRPLSGSAEQKSSKLPANVELIQRTTELRGTCYFLPCGWMFELARRKADSNGAMANANETEQDTPSCATGKLSNGVQYLHGPETKLMWRIVPAQAIPRIPVTQTVQNVLARTPTSTTTSATTSR